MGFLFSVNAYAFIPMVLFVVKNYQKMRFLFSVNVYAFILIVLFLWLKIAKNCQKWVYMGMGKIFLLET